MNKTLLFIVVCLFAFGSDAQAASQSDILGVYWNPTRDGQIELFERAGKVYGKIIWRKENVRDLNNPDPKKRNRRIVGLEFLKGFVFDGDDEWEDGEVYSFRNGKTYSGKIYLEDGELIMRGYVGIPLFGKSMRLTRVEPGQERYAAKAKP